MRSKLRALEKKTLSARKQSQAIVRLDSFLYLEVIKIASLGLLSDANDLPSEFTTHCIRIENIKYDL